MQVPGVTGLLGQREGVTNVQSPVPGLQQAPAQGLGAQRPGVHTPVQAACAVEVHALVVTLQQAPLQGLGVQVVAALPGV